MKKISQREAHALKRRVEELQAAERQRISAWSSEWPRGVHLSNVLMSEGTSICREVLTARKLRHAVVVVPAATGNSRELSLIAVPLESP